MAAIVSNNGFQLNNNNKTQLMSKTGRLLHST